MLTLGITSGPIATVAGVSDEGGDPACWAHLFPDPDPDATDPDPDPDDERPATGTGTPPPGPSRAAT